MPHIISDEFILKSRLDLGQLVKESAIEKDYDSFEQYARLYFKDSAYTKTYSYGLEQWIIELYDLRLIKILVQYAKQDILNKFLEILDNNYQSSGDTADGRYISHTSIKNFSKDAIKIIIDKKSDFSAREVTILHYIFTKNEFDNFIKDKKIDLTAEQYKDLKLEEFDNFYPIVQLEGSGPFSISQALLSRTNVTGISTAEVIKLYDHLASISDKTVSATMTLTAASILDNSTNIRIFFIPGAHSSYQPTTNIVQINTIDVFGFKNIGATIIHELGHYFFDHLYKSNCVPINYPAVQGLVSIKELPWNSKNTLGDENFKKLLAAAISYLDSTASFINLAANILGCEKVDSTYIYHVGEEFDDEKLVKFAKFSCPEINLIKTQVNYTDSIYHQGTQLKNLDYSISIYNFFRNHENFNISSQAQPTCRNILPEKMDYMVNQHLLPAFLHTKSLSLMDIYVVERVNDFVNRGDDIYRDYMLIPSSARSNERLVELFVRLPEFVVMGVGDELLQKIQPMREFWNAFVLPDYQSYMDQYQAKCSQNSIPCLGTGNETDSLTD